MGKKKTGSARGSRKRRGQSENMTGAKEGEVEIRTASVGDNSEFKLPAPDDYDHHRKSILGYLEKKETASGLYRKALQTAQKAGIDTDTMLQAHKLKKANDPIKAKRHFDQLGFALKMEDFPIQLIVHDTLLGEVNEAAYKRGFDDGEAGRTANSRYPDGSELEKEYARGHLHGTGKNMGMTPEQVDTAVDNEEPEKVAAE